MLKNKNSSILYDINRIINSIKENFSYQISYFSSYVPDMQIIKNKALVLCSNVPDDTFNLVINSVFSSKNAYKKIDSIIKIFQKKNLTFSWWIGPNDTPFNLKDILIRKGFIFKDNEYGMYLNLKKYIPVSLNKLQIKQVLNKEELKKFDEVHINSFGNINAFEFVYSKIPPKAYGKKARYRFYNGYINTKVVTTGALVFFADVVGVYFLVTLPEERKKGYATDMMNYLLQIAKKEKESLAILQATKAGHHIYENIGFKNCCLFQEFKLKNILKK